MLNTSEINSLVGKIHVKSTMPFDRTSGDGKLYKAPMLYANDQDAVSCHAKFLSSKSDCQVKPIQLIKASVTKSKQNSYKPKGFTICSLQSKQTSKQRPNALYNKVRVARIMPNTKQVRPQRESQASLNKVDTSNLAPGVRHT